MVAELRKKLVRIFSHQLKIHIAREDFEEFRAEHFLILDSENALNQPFEFFRGHNLFTCSLSVRVTETLISYVLSSKVRISSSAVRPRFVRHRFSFFRASWRILYTLSRLVPSLLAIRSSGIP